MYHFVLWCISRDFAVTLSFPDCYRWFSHIFNDTLRSVPSTYIQDHQVKRIYINIFGEGRVVVIFILSTIPAIHIELLAYILGMVI